MGVEAKGRVITGKEAEKQISQQMSTGIDFSKKEIEFMLKKLREGTYTGYEFETFYAILLKLSTELKKK